jgi:Tfp pilus assembly protein PilF
VGLSLLLSGNALAGKQEDAIKLYKDGVKIANQGKVAEAMAKWEEAVKLFPGLYVAYIKMGMAFEMEDAVPRAQACYDLAVARAKDSADAWNARGEFFLKLRMFPWAVEEFRQAVKLNKDKKKTDIHYNFIKVALQLEELDAAAKALDDLAKWAPKEEDFPFYQGYLRLKQGKDAEAEKAFGALVARNKDSALGHFGLGLLYDKVSEVEKARAEFKTACELKHKPACKAFKARRVHLLGD